MNISPTMLMQRTQAMILAGGRGERLSPLTMFRPKPMLPFGGIFRIVDFTISNCFNSRVAHTALLTQYRHEQFERYVRERWGNQLTCLPPTTGKIYRGAADALLQNLGAIQSNRSEYLILLSCDHVYEMDYRDLLAFHVERGADVTIASAGRRPIGVYVFSTGALLEMLHETRALGFGGDLARDVLPSLARSDRIQTYDFPGYWREIKTLDDYYNANMDLVQPEPMFRPFAGNACGKASVFSGARVSRSVLSFGVCIDQHAWVESSVILPGAHVGKGARLRRAIVEEGVWIPDGYRAGWDAVEDGKHHNISSSGIVVVSQTPAPSRRTAVPVAGMRRTTQLAA